MLFISKLYQVLNPPLMFVIDTTKSVKPDKDSIFNLTGKVVESITNKRVNIPRSELLSLNISLSLFRCVSIRSTSPRWFVRPSLLVSDSHSVRVSGPSWSVRGPWDVIYFLKAITTSYYMVGVGYGKNPEILSL